MSIRTPTDESREHVVDLYTDDQDLVLRVGRHLASGFDVGENLVVVTTPDHRRGIESALKAFGIDVVSASATGALAYLDAAESLASLELGAGIDATRFDEIIGEAIRRAADRGQRVRAYGEMVQLLWERGQVGKAMALESLWNDLGWNVDFSLYCAYRMTSLEHDRSALQPICQLHTAVVSAPRVDLSLGQHTVAEFPAHPTSPRAARHFAIAALARWGMLHCRDEAGLIVSELTTNAMLHARSPFRLEMTWHTSGIRISVHDESSELPALELLRSDRPSGRGLVLVESLSAAWGCELQGDGKDVWAELPAD